MILYAVSGKTPDNHTCRYNTIIKPLSFYIDNKRTKQ